MQLALLRCALPVSLLLLGACASTPPSSVSIHEDRQCPLALHTGQTLILSLPSNPATGYRWQMRETAGELLRSLGPEVYRESELIGGNGLSTWRFEVRSPGQGRLLLAYQRPWEADTEPAGLFDCRIEVE